jgi:tetratricopeptide (TPR) repeat protein
MDPYWLEKKHMDDAPTPLTGKMFAEGTPWGAVLNPTVGDLIKPQIMLPETKKRLTGKGRDIKTVLKNINERTKNKKADYTNDDLLVINGTDIRNATYIPYGQPSPNELIVTGGNVKGMDYLNRLSTIDNYAVPTYVPEDQASLIALPSGGYNAQGDSIQVDVTSNKFTKALARGVNSILGEVYKENNEKGKNLIGKINAAIIERESLGTSVFSSSPDSTSQGTYVYNNLINEYNTRMANYYDEKATPGMINRSIAADHLKDLGHSAKNLSGIHGFLFDTFFGDNSVTYRWENAGSYQSFSGRFWDAGLGGLGGGPMEIARRFFPSSDKSRVDYNPLRNNVADWLPDYLQVGNPFSKLTKGEMRLPGKGYESLNELHPDEYATDGYGAFDRFKILADVAPNSQEYKIWHNIVKHQITDPELKKEVEEIEARTKRMRGSHEFYEYQYLHTDTKYETGVVKEIRKDKVVLVNNQVLSLAGIKFNENYGGELSELIKPGEKIQYRTTDEAINDLENGVVRNAAIYKGADTVNKQLMDMGVAERDKMDTSAIGQLATVTSRQEFWGAMQELIAHARIPILHNKLMHIETALESFESEQINGANLQTWDHPIETVLKPMMNEAMGQSMLKRAAVVAYGRYHFGNVLKNSTSLAGRFGSGFVMATLDPAAMLGGTTNWLWHALNNGRVGRGNDAMGAFSKGAQVGSAIGTMAWGYANADNPLKATVSFALGAVDLYEKLDLGEFAARFGRQLDWKGAAAIGAGIGLAVSALKNPGFDKDKMFGEWQPKKYKEKVKLDEYFDRLEYIKYSGLYNVAARKAMIHEKVNIRHIFKEMDKNKERIGKLTKERQKLLNKYNEGDSRYIARAAKIDEEIAALTQRGNQMFVGGKYTKAAIAYKKAMESTIYGLSENATKDEILASVPDQYKDYFQSFMEVKDEDERKKILKKLPDYLKRPLQAAWGMELSDVQSNRKYFKSHKLPNFAWRGWKPNINLKHVKMKTIENEGMLLSDFGFYESEKAKEAYEIAPDIDNYDSRSLGFSSTLRLKAELKGMGVNLSNITIEKTSTPGFWMTADIKQSISDRMEYGTHSISGAIQSLTANFI